MKTQLLATTAIAILMALPVAANAETTTTTTKVEHSATVPAASPTVGQRLDSGIESTREGIAAAAESVRDFMTPSDAAGGLATVSINKRNTVAGIIGEKVYNVRNEQVATIDDVLFNADGTASKIILANGGIMGMGAKHVAVDFGLLYTRANNDDVIVPITEETIKRMAPFSYEAADAKDGAQTMAAGQVSAKAMLDGELLNARGTEVGSIDNITISEGHASQVIVAYNTTLGMGGEKMAIAYDQLQKSGDNTEVDFKLPGTLSSRFETYVKAAN